MKNILLMFFVFFMVGCATTQKKESKVYEKEIKQVVDTLNRIADIKKRDLAVTVKKLDFIGDELTDISYLLQLLLTGDRRISKYPYHYRIYEWEWLQMMLNPEAYQNYHKKDKKTDKKGGKK